MRKILMSKKGEFKQQHKTDYVKATAIKMMAAVIKKPGREGEMEVVIYNRTLDRTNR